MLSVEVEKRLGDFALHAAFETESGATALFGPVGRRQDQRHQYDRRPA